MIPATSEIRTAVLHVDYSSRASYYIDWLEAFGGAPGFRVTPFNLVRRDQRRRLAESIIGFDLVVLLHSVTADSLIYAEKCRAILQDRTGRLLSFVGNEVSLPGALLGPKIAFLKSIQPDIVATQLLQKSGEYLYAGVKGACVIAVPHALNPAAFQPLTPQAGRPIDIGTRSFKYIAFIGDDDRNRIHDFFENGSFTPALRVDVATSERLNRRDWAAFLNRCKATISTEAGTWWLEPDDRTVLEIRDWLDSRRGGPGGFTIRSDSKLRRIGHLLPWGLKQRLRPLLSRGPIRHEAFTHEALDFETVYQRFFKDRPKSPESGKCISSRHFDAIGAKTCQIMFPGRFNDILKADEHYIALAPDFSNVDDALARFRDPTFRQAMADRSYEYVLDQHTYTHRLSSIRKWLD